MAHGNTARTHSAHADNERGSVRAMTTKQLAELGLSQLAYIRPIMMDGAPAFAVHNADGSPMAVAADSAMAAEAIEHQDLVQVLVH